MTEQPNTELETAAAAVSEATQRLSEAKDFAVAQTERVKQAKVRVHNITAALKTLGSGEDNAEERERGEAALAEAVGQRETEELALVDAREAVKTNQEALKVAKAAHKEAKKGAPKAPKEPRVEQNGIVLPKPDSVSGIVWKIFDDVSATKGSPAAFSEVHKLGVAAGVKEATVRAAYAHWRKFHGVTGRVVSTADQERKVAEAEAKAAAAAAKAAAAEAA